jgi:uncharacterized protein YciI
MQNPIRIFVFLFACSFNLHAQERTYDPALAKKLGADEYGMKKYVLVILKKGPKRDHDSTAAARIQEGHMANIEKLAKEGVLTLAGPFLDDGALSGIFIFNVESVEKAKLLTESDPAVISGRLVMELHPWYGSAAVMEVNDIHKKIQKKEF